MPTKYSYFKDELYSDDVGEDAFELLCRKGVYPYEYIDSFTRFNETKLPEKEKYYSILRNEGITDEEYNFAKEIEEFCPHFLGKVVFCIFYEFRREEKKLSIFSC